MIAPVSMISVVEFPGARKEAEADVEVEADFVEDPDSVDTAIGVPTLLVIDSNFSVELRTGEVVGIAIAFGSEDDSVKRVVVRVLLISLFEIDVGVRDIVDTVSEELDVSSKAEARETETGV